VTAPISYVPGQFFVVRTRGIVGWLIRVGTRSWANHAGIIVDTDGTTVEARPHGAVLGNLSTYGSDHLAYGCGVPATDEQRAAICVEARKLVGTPYGFLDIVSLGLLQYHVRLGFIRRRVEKSNQLICSQLVTVAYTGAGVHLFQDGRLAQDVTPGDLANLLIITNPKETS